MVLVVEDEPAAREALTHFLPEQGFAVMTAATGEEAIEILWQHKERVEWLFTNISLPGLVDGWRVAEEFRFAHPLRSVVYAASQCLDEPLPGAASLFVRKPYHPADVAAAFAYLRRGGVREGLGFPLPRAANSAAEPKRGRCG
jgi:two-component system OmpR family response regulator